MAGTTRLMTENRKNDPVCGGRDFFSPVFQDRDCGWSWNQIPADVVMVAGD
jgi:hypothetical protein